MPNVILHNVTDTRTKQFHSTAIVSERNARWFIPVVNEDDRTEQDVDDMSVTQEES